MPVINSSAIITRALNFIKRSGDSFRGDLIANNNIGIRAKEVGGTDQNLIKMNTSDQVELGNGNNDLILASPLKLPQARITHSVAQSIANNVFTILAFDTERWDNDSIHDNVTNNSRLTAQTAGLYMIIANVEFATNNTGARVVDIRLNGTTIIAKHAANSTTSFSSRIITSTQYQLSIGDFVEVFAFQNSGGSLDVGKGSNYSPEFMMVKVSDF